MDEDTVIEHEVSKQGLGTFGSRVFIAALIQLWSLNTPLSISIVILLYEKLTPIYRRPLLSVFNDYHHHLCFPQNHHHYCRGRYTPVHPGPPEPPSSLVQSRWVRSKQGSSFCWIMISWGHLYIVDLTFQIPNAHFVNSSPLQVSLTPLLHSSPSRWGTIYLAKRLGFLPRSDHWWRFLGL